MIYVNQNHVLLEIYHHEKFINFRNYVHDVNRERIFLSISTYCNTNWAPVTPAHCHSSRLVDRNHHQLCIILSILFASQPHIILCPALPAGLNKTPTKLPWMRYSNTMTCAAAFFVLFVLEVHCFRKSLRSELRPLYLTFSRFVPCDCNKACQRSISISVWEITSGLEQLEVFDRVYYNLTAAMISARISTIPPLHFTTVKR